MTPGEVESLEVRLILEAIHERYGFDFRQYAPESVQRRLYAAQSQLGVAHLGDMLHRILRDPSFFASVLALLTVRVTEMFRDPAFYAAFRGEVLPVLRTYPRLKFWHAGCASGEEVYGMAILLSEEGLYDRSLLYGTDLDVTAIQQAKEGVYSSEQATTFARNYKESGGTANFDSYFTEAYSRISVGHDLRQNVSFFQHDLTSDFVFGEMNVIFCRNVALYFTDPLKEKVMGSFLQALCRGGFLCLGSSETLPVGVRPQFEEFSAGQRIFRARGSA